MREDEQEKKEVREREINGERGGEVGLREEK